MKIKITHYSFFKCLLQSNIILLLNHIEKYEDKIIEGEFNEPQLLYHFFKKKYGSEINPLVTLQYIYMYVPQRMVDAGSLRLNLTPTEMERIVKFRGIDTYNNVNKIGQSECFKHLEQLVGLSLLETRESIWDEALRMNNFLEAYRFWTKSWVKTKAIFHYEFNEIRCTFYLRKIGEKYIVFEAQTIGGNKLPSNKLMDLQNKIDLAILDYKSKAKLPLKKYF